MFYGNANSFRYTMVICFLLAAFLFGEGILFLREGVELLLLHENSKIKYVYLRFSKGDRYRK